MISETGTLPPPREPLTDREQRLMRRLTDHAEQLNTAAAVGGIQSERMLALLGIDLRPAREPHHVDVQVYARGVAEGMRRAAQLIDPPPQGIA